MKYHWNNRNKKAIQVTSDLHMSQFDFIGTSELDGDFNYGYSNLNSLIVCKNNSIKIVYIYIYVSKTIISI